MTNSHKAVTQADAHAPATHASTHNAGGTDAMTNPQFTTIELGAASDTTLARSSAGVITVEGNRIFAVGGTDVPIADGGTGASTASAAFNALSPMTTSGDIIYGGASGAGTRLAKGSDGQVLTLASGLPSWAAASGGAAFAGVRASSNADTACSDSTWTAIALAAADTFDTGSYHDTVTNNSRITANATGYFIVHATFSWRNSTNTATRYGAIYKNGSAVLTTGASHGTSSDNVPSHVLVDIIPVVNTDYIQIYAYQETGGTLNAHAAVVAVQFIA